MLACAANASPLVALSSIKRLDLLRNACPQVWVPDAVVSELCPCGEPWAQAEQALEELAKADWMKRIAVPASPLVQELNQRLGGSGEAEVIAWAHDHELPALLDELAGRRAARQRGVHVFGSLHILRLAKETGHIDRARPLIEGIIAQGIYYSDELIEGFLHELREI